MCLSLLVMPWTRGCHVVVCCGCGGTGVLAPLDVLWLHAPHLHTFVAACAVAACTYLPTCSQHCPNFAPAAAPPSPSLGGGDWDEVAHHNPLDFVQRFVGRLNMVGVCRGP